MYRLVLLILSLLVGLILSAFSTCLAFLVVFCIYTELINFCFFYGTDQWCVTDRVGFLFAYILGWYIGRSLHGLKSYTISKRYDKSHDINLIK